MAVIDTSVNKPKSCMECYSYQGVNGCCTKGCFLPYSLFDNGDTVPQDCPFKSIDHLKDEINWLHKIGNPKDGKVYVPINDVLDVIDKFCNREKETHG